MENITAVYTLKDSVSVKSPLFHVSLAIGNTRVKPVLLVINNVHVQYHAGEYMQPSGRTTQNQLVL